MSSFLFDGALEKCFRNQMQLGTGTFYAHLVTATPDKSLQTFGDLTTIPTGGNYTYKQLFNPDNDTNKRLVDIAGILTLAFENPLWAGLTTSDNAPLTGLVIVAGINTNSHLFCYLERQVNSVATPFTPDGSPLEFDLKTGFVQFDYTTV
jgi:hypothetical protein